MPVPFDIEHRRQSGRVVWNMGFKPGRLLLHRPAPIRKMIGAPRHARGLGRSPVLGKFIVDPIAALGRFDPRKAHTRGAHAIPIDIALVSGYVDAANLIIAWSRQKIGPGYAASASASEQRKAEPPIRRKSKKPTEKMSHRW